MLSEYAPYFDDDDDFEDGEDELWDEDDEDDFEETGWADGDDEDDDGDLD